MKTKKLVVAFVLVVAGVAAAESVLANPPKERVVFVCAHPDDLAGPSGTAILLARKFDVHVIDYNNRAGGGSTDSTQFHFANLVDCIRANAPEKAAANADIGTKSTMLALLGNISQTTGEAIRVDPATGRMLNRGAAENLWSRVYAKGWEV